MTQNNTFSHFINNFFENLIFPSHLSAETQYSKGFVGVWEKFYYLPSEETVNYCGKAVDRHDLAHI